MFVWLFRFLSPCVDAFVGNSIPACLFQFASLSFGSIRSTLLGLGQVRLSSGSLDSVCLGLLVCLGLYLFVQFGSGVFGYALVTFGLSVSVLEFLSLSRAVQSFVGLP